MEDLIVSTKTINEFLPYLKQSDTGDNLNDKFRISLSIGLFLGKVISIERAANLAGKKTVEFIEILIEKNIPWHNYNDENNELDTKALRKYKQLADND
jgi:predicted HTH domain antitoxin